MSWDAAYRALVVLVVMACIAAGFLMLLWACGYTLDFGVGKIGPVAQSA